MVVSQLSLDDDDGLKLDMKAAEDIFRLTCRHEKNRYRIHCKACLTESITAARVRGSDTERRRLAVMLRNFPGADFGFAASLIEQEPA